MRVEACPSRDGMAGDPHVWQRGACVFCGETQATRPPAKGALEELMCRECVDRQLNRPPVVGGSSPWGQIQHAETFADGLVMVSTASHGGLWVRPDLESLIPANCKSIARQYAPTGWYEEDCDCAIPLALLPGVSAREREYAQRMVRTDKRFRAVALLLDGLKEQAARMTCGVSADGKTLL